MLAGGEIFCLAGQQCVVEELTLYLCKADAFNGISEAFAGDALVAEEQDGLFNRIEDLFLAREDPVERNAVLYVLAPAAADIDAVAVHCVVKDMERAGADAASAVIAGLRINGRTCRALVLQDVDRAAVCRTAYRAGLAF